MERPKVGVLAVVRRGDEMLMVKRARAPNAGLWGFPGGHVELGETCAEAALRELAEETGVSARAGRTLGVLDAIGREGGAVAWHYVLVAVLCRWEAGEPVAADDAADAGWFDAGARAGLRMTPNVDRVIGWLGPDG